MKRKISNKILIILAIIVFMICIDQILKIVLVNKGEIFNGLINLTYLENKGVAFGIFPDSVITIIIVNIFVLYMLVRFMVVQKGRINLPTFIGGMLILSGGISNLLDRIFRGYVIDYIDVPSISNFQVLNFADLILIIGWIVVVAGIVKTTVELRGK